MRGRRGAVLISLLAGCSGGGPSAPPANTGGLDDGAHLTTALEIPAGTTATIPRGAKILADRGVTITVRGTLRVASAETHARVSAADLANPWAGIVVANGGQLDADGLDLVSPETALTVGAGSLGARYDHGTITSPAVPFRIEAGARLDTAYAAVVDASASSSVSGELHASYLDYAMSPLGGGIITMDPTAVLDASDSTFHGAATSGSDYIVSYAASLVRVVYSTITEAHCAFHFNDVARFEIDHVTAGAKSPTGQGGLVAYGAMLYGSGAGPHTISNSNFLGGGYALDEQNANGPLTIVNTYTKGTNANDGASSWTWLPADVAPAPVLDAKPR
ncbi:MAG TPA: hypothetical protein VHK47_24485 [Polyangia bacterium]|nr:hypothetical protein [Polyangia bacterium]